MCIGDGAANVGGGAGFDVGYIPGSEFFDGASMGFAVEDADVGSPREIESRIELTPHVLQEREGMVDVTCRAVRSSRSLPEGGAPRSDVREAGCSSGSLASVTWSLTSACKSFAVRKRRRVRAARDRLVASRTYRCDGVDPRSRSCASALDWRRRDRSAGRGLSSQSDKRSARPFCAAAAVTASR